jgi:hypothetical protein
LTFYFPTNKKLIIIFVDFFTLLRAFAAATPLVLYSFHPSQPQHHNIQASYVEILVRREI